jgi:hypothetical protein
LYTIAQGCVSNPGSPEKQTVKIPQVLKCVYNAADSRSEQEENPANQLTTVLKRGYAQWPFWQSRKTEDVVRFREALQTADITTLLKT